MAATFVRSRSGRITLGAIALLILLIVLILLLTGGNGGAKNGKAAEGSSPGSATSSSSSAGSSNDAASASGPNYAVATVENCLKTLFGDDSVSDFPGSQSSVSQYRQATTVVDVEGEGEGSQSSSGTLLFFSTTAKAAAAVPAVQSRYKDEAVSQPNGGSVIFKSGHLSASAQVDVMGCVQ